MKNKKNNNYENKKRKSIKSKDKRNDNSDSNNFLNNKSHSNKNTNSMNDSFLRYNLTTNYNKELINKFSTFLQTKKFKISNEFDAKNSKKFLDKKNKYLEKIILTDIIENNENKDSEQANKRGNRRKSGTQNNNIKNYFIVVTNYDDETQNEKKYNFSVKPQARRINNLKKNKNLSKYLLNNNNSSVSDIRAKSE
jgi:hypothetical protein